MENDLFKITIKIAERSYNPTIKRSDEALYRKAVKAVNLRLDKYKKMHPKQDMQTYLSLVSLDLAISMIKEEDDNGSIEQKLRILEEELAECLKK